MATLGLPNNLNYFIAQAAQKLLNFFSTPTFQVELLNKHLFITAKPMIFFVIIFELILSAKSENLTV